MIVSRPQTGTITSFVLFLLITIIVVAMNVLVILQTNHAAWYNYAVVVILTPIGLFVFYKIFISYKVLSLGNNQIQIDLPVLRQSKKYPIEQIQQWTEMTVKTGKKSEYKELKIAFNDGRKINIGLREYTEYARIVQYLAQKASRKKAL